MAELGSVRLTRLCSHVDQVFRVEVFADRGRFGLEDLLVRTIVPREIAAATLHLGLLQVLDSFLSLVHGQLLVLVVHGVILLLERLQLFILTEGQLLFEALVLQLGAL